MQTRIPQRGLLLLVFLLSVIGCVELLSLEGRPCPCAAGYVCCETTRHCLREGQVCASLPPDLPPTPDPTGDCRPECAPGAFCYKPAGAATGQCLTCANNKRCGAACQDCTALSGDWACVSGACGCRGNADCPSTHTCQEGKCVDEGISSIIPITDRSNGCGDAFVDCRTEQTNWSCLQDQCGCFGDPDCQPGEKCTAEACTAQSR